MEKSPDIRFMVDHMLIKLGKYLRILGYDAAWDKEMRTHELIVRANLEKRVFLTRNTRLPHQYPAVKKVMLLVSTDPVEQLTEVVNQA
ncbi:MAG: Mut7-C RNAse domain-containing protein, partial [Candidatus Omnitrophota bacterium]